MKQPGLYVLHAAAVRDAVGVDARPGSVLVRDGRVVAAGDPESLPAELVARAEVIDKRDSLLLPAMVNAHTHLELTGIGPQPYDPAGGFVGWVRMVRSHGPEVDSIWHRSVNLGAARCREAGVQAVGDIGLLGEVDSVKRDYYLDGVWYAQLFGLGPPHDDDAGFLIRDAIQDGRNGLQPHAPYSAGPGVYARAVESGLPLSTHLAEHADEAEFVGRCSGPMLDYLKAIGKWDESFAEHYGQGLSPVQWMRPYLERAARDGGWLVAHCNYVDDHDIKLLADTNTHIAYCPIASEYFGHTGHRYRDMLVAGVNVCLGTDSIVCADPGDPQPLGLLSAMRRLYKRDRTDPRTLLAMATTHGSKALRLGSRTATLGPGAPARFACIAIDPDIDTDPLVQVLTRRDPIEAILF